MGLYRRSRDGAAEYSDYKFEDPATRMTGGNGRIDLNGKPRAEAAYTELLLKERQVRLLQLILFTRKKSFVLPAGS